VVAGQASAAALLSIAAGDAVTVTWPSDLASASRLV